MATLTVEQVDGDLQFQITLDGSEVALALVSIAYVATIRDVGKLLGGALGLSTDLNAQFDAIVRSAGETALKAVSDESA